MKKKVLASIIAMTMAAACLTACGDSSKTEENTSSSKAESSSSAETTTTTTTAATTAPTTTTTQPTTDPNGYAQKLVGVWEYEMFPKYALDSDKDTKIFGKILFTDDGKRIEWGYTLAKPEGSKPNYYGPRVYEYKVENNMLDGQYIVELTDNKLALNDNDSHINAQEYIKSNLGEISIDEALKIVDAYQCTNAIESALYSTKNVNTYPDSKGVVPVSSLENSNDPIEKNIYWSIKEYAQTNGKSENELGYVYYNSSWFKIVSEATGSEMKPEYMFIQWSETKEGSPVGECCYHSAGFKDFESSKNVKLGEMPKSFSSYKLLESQPEIY